LRQGQDVPPARPDPGEQSTSSPAAIAGEVAALQAALLARLCEEMADGDAELFADAAQRLAEAFGAVTATAVDALSSRTETDRDPLTSLYGAEQMSRRLNQLIETHKRYGHPFALALFDFEGPGARVESNGSAAGTEAVMAIVGGALRESIRLADEAFHLGPRSLCVLAPNQTTVDAVQMAQRLARILTDLEAKSGLRITISAGVASCPEHGTAAERLLRECETAMWRARSVGQPVGVGDLQDR
jgi:diguanylate cyclase (GGDEF)-like protein